jgi:NADH-quinone oxidoreductase subunit G
MASLPKALWEQLDLSPGAQVRITQAGGGAVQMPARLDAGLAANVVRVPAGLPETAALGAGFGTLTVAKA